MEREFSVIIPSYRRPSLSGRGPASGRAPVPGTVLAREPPPWPLEAPPRGPSLPERPRLSRPAPDPSRPELPRHPLAPAGGPAVPCRLITKSGL